MNVRTYGNLGNVVRKYRCIRTVYEYRNFTEKFYNKMYGIKIRSNVTYPLVGKNLRNDDDWISNPTKSFFLTVP